MKTELILCKTDFRFASLLCVLALCSIDIRASAQQKASNTQPTNNPSAASPASAGLLPVPDYSGDLWERGYLTGDWGGARTNLANKGVQLGLQWNQYVQGIPSGGRAQDTEYGGNVDYTANLDLMRMGILPGALIKFRAESRYGNSVNRVAGAILPVNSDAFFPITSPPDQDIAVTITDLNYTQFLSQHLGVFFGKLDTLDSDLNEFASGRGTSQFMNANFLFNPALALRLPYSTLGAGIVWMPIPVGPKGGVTLNSSVINTADSSETTGFQDFNEGQSWSTELDLQYRLACLPGGMNFGGLWSFNQDFARLGTRIVLQPGESLVIPKKHSTWAAYWSTWQYLYTSESSDKPINLLDGQPDLKGVGLFARFGYADPDTNPTKWAASGGLGGRGVFPTRDNDTFGIGYYYNRVQTLNISSLLGLDNSAQGFEAFYNLAFTPAFHLTFDVQVVNGVAKRIQTATILGLRASLNF
jgi:porin